MERHIDQLTRLFLQFPGIGERQARRFAYFIVAQPEQYVQRLTQALSVARGNAHTCEKCFRIFEGDTDTCSICSDPTRDAATILVIEKSQDIESFTSTDYKGMFFVLGGLIPIIQKRVIESVRIEPLKSRIKTDLEKNILKEIILAFPLTPNGDHTDETIRNILKEAFPSGISLSSLGRGLSTGTELEYADPLSLNASLKKRE